MVAPGDQVSSEATLKSLSPPQGPTAQTSSRITSLGGVTPNAVAVQGRVTPAQCTHPEDLVSGPGLAPDLGII